jgi:SAM-dependent methyltransferase
MSQGLAGNTFEMLATAKGTVLDLGPGTGCLVARFNPDLIDQAYGAEPAVDMHPELQRNIDAAGLTDKYKKLPCGAEPTSLIPCLAKEGLLGANGNASEGTFDTIVCTRVLCGVPNHQATIDTLYRLLKPGGRFIVCEHVTSPWPELGTLEGYLTQKFWAFFGWNLFMGGCKLDRDTVGAFKRAGGETGWQKFELAVYQPWHPIPFMVGELIKS